MPLLDRVLDNSSYPMQTQVPVARPRCLPLSANRAIVDASVNRPKPTIPSPIEAFHFLLDEPFAGSSSSGLPVLGLILRTLATLLSSC